MAERGYGLPKISLTTGDQRFYVQGTASASGWFGPLNPLPPSAPPQVAGRQFDLQPGYNIQTTPRSSEPIGFSRLRALADAYDLLRLVIETRKDQVDRMEWKIRAKKDFRYKIDQKRVDAVTKFFERPDGEHTFSQWLRMLLEDLFVIDAPVLWRQRTRGGQLIALHPLDGATIKRIIDDWGRTPQPYTDENGILVTPPAYQQVLKGFPAVNYTTNDLIYAPRNIRTNRVYGYSPVEQIIVTVDIALRRQLSIMDYYTEGNIPSSLIGVPDTWTPDQIKAFQDYWDLYFTGDTAARRKAKFVPGGVAKTFIQTQEPELKGIYDEWLARVVCFAFSVSSQPLMSQVNRATANTQKEMSEEEGLVPILMWVKRLIDPIIAVELNEPNVEFVWSQDEQMDSAQEATMMISLSNSAMISKNEGRDRLGWDRDAAPEADLLGFTTGTGFVPLDESKKPEPPAPILPVATAGGSGGGDPPEEKKKNPPTPKTTDGQKEEGDVAKTLEELFDLSKNEGHDVSDQPRDDKGRFSSSGGPTYAERKKAERKASADPEKDPIARDEHGRFASGKITRARVTQIAQKIAGDLAFAGGIAALATAVVAVTPKSGGVGVTVMRAAVDVAKKTAGVVVLSSAEQAISTALRVLGMETGIAETAARFVKSHLRTAMKSYGSDEEKEKKSKKSDDSDDTEKMLKGALSSDDEGNVLAFARMFLPPFIDSVRDRILDEVEVEVDGDQMSAIEEGVSAAASDLRNAVSAMQKSLSVQSLQKSLRPLKPLPQNHDLETKVRKRLLHTVGTALQSAGAAAATLVAADLSDVLQRALEGSGTPLAKASPSPDAARIAASLDLSAVEDIHVALGDDLAELSEDSSLRTLVQLGVDSNSELTGQVSEESASWARHHAAELLGKKIHADGTVVDTTVDGYTITDSTRSMVRDVISRGLENGDTAEEIAEAVREAGFSKDRAQRIVDFEVGNAHSAGTLEAYAGAEAAGVQISKGWITVGDEKVDNDICKMNEDQGPIPVNQPFQSGHMAPLGHANCRCALVAYVGDQETDSESDAEKMLKYEEDRHPRDERGRWTTGAMATSFAAGAVTAVSLAAAAYFGKGLITKMAGPILRGAATTVSSKGGSGAVTRISENVLSKDGITTTFHVLNRDNYQSILSGDLESLRRFTKGVSGEIYVHVTKDGDSLAHIFGILSSDAKTFGIRYIVPKNVNSMKDMRDGVKTVGTKGVKIIKDLIAARMPTLEHISGERISGARTGRPEEVVARIRRAEKMIGTTR